MKIIPKLQGGTWPNWWTIPEFQGKLKSIGTPYDFKAGNYLYQYPRAGLESRDRASEFNNYQKNYNLVGYTQNKNREWIKGAPLVGGKNSTYPYLYKPTGQGDYADLEKQPFYLNNVDMRIDKNGELTPMGRFFINKYIESLDPNNKTRKALEEYRNSGFKFTGFNRNGKYLGNWKEFFNAVSLDHIGGPGHNIVELSLAYNADKTRNLDNDSEVFSDTSDLKGKGWRPLPNWDTYIDTERKTPLEPSYYKLNRYGTTYGGERWYNFSNPELDKIPGETDKFTVDNNYLNNIRKDLGIELPKNDKSILSVEDPDNRKKGLAKLFGDISLGFGKLKNLNKNTSPFVDLALRTIADNAYNSWNTNRLIRDMDVGLKKYTPSYREVSGDYIALKQAEELAARLRNVRPITSNALAQSAIDQEAIQKGNLIIQQGNLQDATRYRLTSEAAWTQNKENTVGWNEVANYNTAALAEFKNKIAKLKYKTRLQNMQNLDVLLTDREKRRWLEYDYEKEKERYAKELLADLDLENNMYDEEWYNNYNEYQPLATKYWNDRSNMSAEEAKRYSELLKYMNLEEVRRKYQKLYNMSLRYKVPYNLPSMFSVDKTTGKVVYAKLGLKFQTGGVTALSSFVLNPYLKKTSPDYSEKSSKQTEDKEGKSLDSLMKSIVETLKGLEGLPNDVADLSNYLMGVFDILRYSPTETKLESLYPTYIQALVKVNNIRRSAKNFDNAYQVLKEKNALGSPAIDSQGLVYVGIAGTNKIDRITPQQYINDVQNKGGQYTLLTAGNLLDLRLKRPDLTYWDGDITEMAGNGTNLENIHKYVKDMIGNLGKDKESRDMLVRSYGNGAIEGLNILQLLVSLHLSDSDTAKIISSLNNSLTEMNLTTELQAKQAELAISAIYSFLPKNMKSMLLLEAGNEENVLKMVTAMVLKNVSTSANYSVKDFNALDESGNVSGSKKKSEGSSGSDKDPKETTATKWVQGYGQKRTFTISTGGSRGWTVRGNTMPITDSSDKPVGLTTLQDISTAFGGTLDLTTAFMGNSRISSLGLHNVLIETGDITKVALPIDPNATYKKPWFDRLNLLELAAELLQAEGIDPDDENLSSELKKRVNEVYSNLKLGNKFNADGSLNKLKFAYFGLVKGIAKELAFEDSDEFNRDYLIEASKLERLNYEEIMKKLNKDWSLDNGFIWGGDKVYRGTIFIPVNTNIHNTQSGYGSSYAGTPSLDMNFEMLLQRQDAIDALGGIHKITNPTNFNPE